MATKRDFYEVLGVSKTATEAEIKSAYRKMALKFHPDRNKAADAETKFKEINEAYQVLSDQQKKQSYDQFGHAAFDPASGGFGAGGANPFGGGARSGPFTWSYNTSQQGGQGANVDFGDPFEIFESFFGGGFASQARRPRYSLSIEFLEAVTGTEKQVEIEGKKHTIKVPAGANDGTRIRYDSFDITIDVKTDVRFKRDGHDLYLDENIDIVTAILGGTVSVKTIDQTLKLKIRPGTQSHTMVRLRGEGVPHIQSRGKGDLYVRIIVVIPEKISRQQKKLLEEFQAEAELS